MLVALPVFTPSHALTPTHHTQSHSVTILLLPPCTVTSSTPSSPSLSPPAAQYALLNSTVSSRMLSAVAKAEGIYHEETLTGFKWMGNRTQQLAEQGIEVIFAYEEAIGERSHHMSLKVLSRAPPLPSTYVVQVKMCKHSSCSSVDVWERPNEMCCN